MTVLRSCTTSTLALALLMTSSIPALAASGPIAIVSGDAIRGTSSVVIGAFTVGFIFQAADNEKATGGMIGAFGGVTSAKTELEGVTPAMMQAITDAAYADFQTQVASRGFSVADSGALFASSQLVRAKPEKSPFETKVFLGKNASGKVTFYKPSALPSLLMVPGDFTATQGFGGLGAMGSAMNDAQTQAALAEYAKASGQSVIDVVYLIDFANLKRGGGTVKVSSSLSVASNFSKLTLVNPRGKVAHLTLKEAIPVDGDFATMDDKTKGKGVQTGANIASGLLGAASILGGGGGLGMKFGKSRSYAFTVNPNAYTEGAGKAASLASTRLLDQVVALK